MPTAGDASTTNADQRDLMLSCGAALHHLRIGLAAAGVAASVYRMPSGQIRSRGVHRPREDGTDRVDATLSDRIPLPRSDRRPFRSWPMPEAFQRQLTERAAEQGALLRVINDPDARAVLVTAFAAAAAAQSVCRATPRSSRTGPTDPAPKGFLRATWRDQSRPPSRLHGTSASSACCHTTSSRKGHTAGHRHVL